MGSEQGVFGGLFEEFLDKVYILKIFPNYILYIYLTTNKKILELFLFKPLQRSKASLLPSPPLPSFPSLYHTSLLFSMETISAKSCQIFTKFSENVLWVFHYD